MRLSHAGSAVPVRFDDPNLVGSAGLVPLVALAQRCGLGELADAFVRLAGPGGANPGAKVTTVVAAMTAGADSISDCDVLRHGGMGRLFDQVLAPSTIGTFLRAFTFGHVRQLDAVLSRFTAALIEATPVLPGLDGVCFIDVDDTAKATYGHAKHGVGIGHAKLVGLNVLLATLSTPVAAPLMVGGRLRGGTANSARGAGRFVTEAIGTARRAGAGRILVRTDSGFYTHAVITACRRTGADFSVTARLDTAVRAAVEAIDEAAWTPIRYPDAVFDQDTGTWISDAEVAETTHTAFTGSRHTKAEQVTARLIVRRVRKLGPATSTAGQGELFPTWRYHPIFTDTDLPMLEAETTHRRHAIVEQVIADLKGGPLGHLPSGRFAANAAWLALAAISHNLLRAAGTLAAGIHATARPATLRARLVNIPARIARSARRITLHLPTNWPWRTASEQLHTAALHPT
jgi:hypothetical protein